MPREDSLAATSLVLSAAVAAIAVALGYWQWADLRARGADLGTADRAHFLHQDWRRAAGVPLMLALAIGIYVGSRIPAKLDVFVVDAGVKQAMRAVGGAWVGPATAGRANPRFVVVWLVVFTLLLVLLALALFDWLATRRYARRQRESLARERIELLRETFRRQQHGRDDHPPEPRLNGA